MLAYMNSALVSEHLVYDWDKLPCQLLVYLPLEGYHLHHATAASDAIVPCKWPSARAVKQQDILPTQQQLT